MNPHAFKRLTMASLFLCAVSITLWLSVAPNATWHFTYSSGQPATQNNFDLTLSRGMTLSYTSNRWIRWSLRSVTLPLGAILLATAVLPLAWFRRTSKRPTAGFCTNCGYDLCATPERCPECGVVVPPLARASRPC
jgi:hypothetical protein